MWAARAIARAARSSPDPRRARRPEPRCAGALTPPDGAGSAGTVQSGPDRLPGGTPHARALSLLCPRVPPAPARLTFTESTGYMTMCSMIPAIAPAVMWVDKEALVGRFS